MTEDETEARVVDIQAATERALASALDEAGIRFKPKALRSLALAFRADLGLHGYHLARDYRARKEGE